MEETLKLFERLNSSSLHLAREKRKTGSRFPPLGIVSPNGLACGVLEDTLNCKTLLVGGGELVSAHLSNFAYKNPESGAALLRSALSVCQDRHIPALFVALPVEESQRLLSSYNFPETTVTTASIFGLGIPKNETWNINTSEI